MAHDSDDVTRRTVLKAVGAGALGAGAAASGSAGARRPAELDAREAQFADATRARWAIAAHGDEVLSELADRGYVESAGAGSFAGPVLDRGEFAAADEGLHVTAVRTHGTDTAHVVAKTRTADHAVTLVVQPHRDRAFASVESLATGERFRVDPRFDDVETQGPCYYTTECYYETCGTCLGTEYEEECCEQGGTTTCETIGPTGYCCCQ